MFRYITSTPSILRLNILFLVLFRTFSSPALFFYLNEMAVIMFVHIFYSITSFCVHSILVRRLCFCIIFAWFLPAAMMEANYGSNCSKIEKMRYSSIPPGFASLTSFYLTRDDKLKKTDTSDPIPTATKPEMDDNIYTLRPWIISDQSKCKPEESHTEHLPMDKLVICNFLVNDIIPEY